MRKAQALIISSITLVLVLVVIISVFIFIYRSEQSSNGRFEEIQETASRTGNILTSRPIPIEWDENISKPGLVINGVVAYTTLDKFGELDYSKSKLLIGMANYNYIFYFESKTGITEVHGREFWGCNAGLQDMNGGDNLQEAKKALEKSPNAVTDKRFVTLEDKGMRQQMEMTILVWEGNCENVSYTPYYGPGYFDFFAELFTDKKSYVAGENIYLVGP